MMRSTAAQSTLSQSQEFAAIGLAHYWDGYFAGRAAPLGLVSAAPVVATYNRMFNSNASADYAGLGEGLDLPGLNPDITPHAYQRAAVARVLNEPTVLLDHVVGAGKTRSMVMAAMELRRTGIANKSAIIVPNHLVD